jgi:predicted  nucleic acid-binding Zn-ribbon protein
MPRRASKKASKNGLARKGSTPRFAEIVRTESQRLQKLLHKALGQKSEIEREVAEIQGELDAMQAFISAKRGGGVRVRKGRAKRGERREQILNVIKDAADGLTRGEIIQKLNATEKSLQQSISNALNNLFKAKAVTRKGRKYHPA